MTNLNTKNIEDKINEDIFYLSTHKEVWGLERDRVSLKYKVNSTQYGIYVYSIFKRLVKWIMLVDWIEENDKDFPHILTIKHAIELGIESCHVYELKRNANKLNVLNNLIIQNLRYDKNEVLDHLVRYDLDAFGIQDFYKQNMLIEKFSNNLPKLLEAMA